MKYILGIDPGLSGAMALIDPETNLLKALYDMPLTTKTDYKGHRSLDHEALSGYIDAIAKDVRFAVIEDVHAMPKQGVSSTFAFGKSFGIIIGAVASYNIPIFFPRPVVWKQLMGLSSNKQLSLKKATELFPGSSHLWPLKKHDGRAEAALLAWFGKRFL